MLAVVCPKCGVCETTRAALGVALRSVRVATGMPMRAIAKMAGVSVQLVGRVELGEISPNRALVSAYARAADLAETFARNRAIRETNKNSGTAAGAIHA